MGKLLIFLSIAVLLFMSFGEAIAPQSALFLLAPVDTTYQYVRVLLIVLLAIQLVTRPPRHVWFRLFTGFMAIVIFAWVVLQTYSYNMLPLDTLSIIGASITIAATALERKSVTVRFKTLSQCPGRHLYVYQC